MKGWDIDRGKPVSVVVRTFLRRLKLLKKMCSGAVEGKQHSYRDPRYCFPD